MRLRLLRDLPLISQKRVFLRLDLNVPISNGQITDTTRITSALPTIKFLMEKGLKITLASHLGRPTEKKEEEFSLEIVGEKIAELLKCDVLFVRDYVEEDLQATLDQQKPEQLVLLENLRFFQVRQKTVKILQENSLKDLISTWTMLLGPCIVPTPR